MDENKLSITISPDAKWLPIIADTTKKYFQSLQFPENLCDMISDSLQEGCDELVRFCQEKSINAPFQVSLDFLNDAAVIQIIYDSRISLHPHQTANYEVPSSIEELDDINMATLWLHLIKRRMDRVFFKVDGSRQILQMIKYHREADKAHQLWIMNLTPKLRSDIKIEVEDDSKHVSAGAIIQNPENGTVLKLDASGLFIVRHLDGEKTFHEIYMEYIDEVGMISPQQLVLIFEKLEKNGMLDEKEKSANEHGVKSFLSRILNPMFSLSDADRIINIVYRYTFWIFKPICLILLLGIGVSGIVPLLKNWSTISESIANLGEFYMKYPFFVIPLYVLMLLTIIIHEFGHALTCKHFGGSVNRMGIMFYLTMFVFFCDTSSAWKFSSKWRRIAVSLGGAWFTFVLLGVLLHLFGLCAASGSLWTTVWATLILFNLIGLILNFNPFIKMDGYYILMDLTNIPNLRKRSFDFLKMKALKVFAKEKKNSEITSKEKLIYWVYGVSGAVVTVLFIVVPLFLYARQLLLHRGSSGKIIFAVIVIILTLLRISHSVFLSIRSMRYQEYKLT